MNEIQKHMINLGLPAKDAVTGFSGVITAINFDLYGCVQAVLTPPMDKNGDLPTGLWFDIARLKVTSDSYVLPVPDFSEGYIAEGKKGAALKSLPDKFN